MEQIITVQQAQNNFLSIIEQVQNLGSSFIVTANGKPQIKISVIEDANESKNLAIQNKRNAGFMKNTNNTPAPANFDRMNEDELLA